MMKKTLLIASLLLTVVACKKETQTEGVTTQNDTIQTVEDDIVVVDDDENNTEEKVITLNAASDSNLEGTVTFTQEGDEVKMVVDINGVTPGEHAIHIHENGDCSAPDASSAGGHWNPTNTEHGKFNVEAFHMGDIGNLTADENGHATMEFSTDKWCLGCDDNTKNLIGHAVIVHEGVDDFTSQPSGAAGDRIGCAVIE